jgi:phosphoribosylanthranilate isomerase
MTLVKICGLKDPENIAAAVDAGADFIGFVFYAPSPRFITPEDAKKLSVIVPPHVKKIGLFVNANDAEIEAARASIDMIQLHGDEMPDRASEIKARFDLPVIKAVRIGGSGDVITINEFEDIVDWILVDARTKNEYGGTGHTFDWNLLREKTFKKPWMLSGGLNAENVKSAITALKPTAVDVSSGVETSKGAKNSKKITEFIRFVK